MNSTPTIADAIILAARVHRDQRDKAGQPYILHPLRVMLRRRDETSQIVPVLHDRRCHSAMSPAPKIFKQDTKRLEAPFLRADSSHVVHSSCCRHRADSLSDCIVTPCVLAWLA